MVFFILLGSLALLAATANIFLTIRERKRREKRNAALMQYIDVTADKLIARIAETECLLEAQDKRLRELESGTVANYEKAKEAANALNDFNAGISGILGFDPMEALRKQREREGDT